MHQARQPGPPLCTSLMHPCAPFLCIRMHPYATFAYLSFVLLTHQVRQPGPPLCIIMHPYAPFLCILMQPYTTPRISMMHPFHASGSATRPTCRHRRPARAPEGRCRLASRSARPARPKPTRAASRSAAAAALRRPAPLPDSRRTTAARSPCVRVLRLPGTSRRREVRVVSGLPRWSRARPLAVPLSSCSDS